MRLGIWNQDNTRTTPAAALTDTKIGVRIAKFLKKKVFALPFTPIHRTPPPLFFLEWEEIFQGVI